MPDESARPSAVISGSATGIGAACARHLAAAGLNVVINYTKSADEAEATAQACRALGVEALVVRGDVGVDADCRALVAAAREAWGGLDVLVNNAGTTRFADANDLESLSKDDFEAIFAVNVTGAYQLTRAAAPALKTSHGAVVNVSSHSGFSGIGSSMAYAASKGALNTLTLSLARTLAPEVRVNAVCPGFVDTRWMTGKLNEAEMAAFRARAAEIAPLKLLVTPDQVAEAVCWFALGGRAVTGQLLV
ncbi:MAG: SDR family oxidoreductase, partial [Kiloniellales bacterium]|nr:SDR family oxidoreductase [Kiloniellales bacterium]